jgi:hypothetical protein
LHKEKQKKPKVKIMEKASEIKKKLEDAEYKDLKQRYNHDEGDNNYVLDKEEEIKAHKKQQIQEANIKLDESLDKIEEEQDIVFKRKVGEISHGILEEMKNASDVQEINLTELQSRMIDQVFASFLTNKQELLKKIAGRLASHKDPEYDEDDSDEEEEDGDPEDITPNEEIQEDKIHPTTTEESEIHEQRMDAKVGDDK